MLGAIIGDIVGSAWDRHPTNNYHFPMFTEKNSYTDDTVCTVAVADAVLHGSEDYGSYLRMWCTKYPHPKGGYGGNFRRWLVDNPAPYNSFGSGSAMRVSPVSWVYTDVADILYHARKSAECTHSHPEGIKGAQAVAYTMQAVCDGLMFGDRKYYYKPRIEGTVEAFNYQQLFEKPLYKTQNKFDETCPGTIPIAMRILCDSDSFEDAIRKAVCHGSDADTLAAIVGSVAERIWGIPEWMKMRAMRYIPMEMRMVIERFRHYVVQIQRLSAQCRYFRYGQTFACQYAGEAYAIEKRWVYDLARSRSYGEEAKASLRRLSATVNWQEIADRYRVSMSYLWYVIETISPSRSATSNSQEELVSFLDKYYR